MTLLGVAALGGSLAVAAPVQVPTGARAAVTLERRPGAGAPVLLVHGIASRGAFFDLGPGEDFADVLSQAGFDVWLVDLRGHGHSRDGYGGAPGGLDAYGTADLRAAIDHVRATTGAPQVGLVGHSMGGMAAGVLLATGGHPALGALVVLGSPVDFRSRDGLRAVGRAGMRLGGVLPRIGVPAMARWASRWRRLPFGLEDALWSPGSLTAAERAALLHGGVSPMFPAEQRQIARAIRRGGLLAQGAPALPAIDQSPVPILAVAGAGDRVAPPETVRRWAAGTGGPREWVLAGVDAGFPADLGHCDLVVGRAAREAVAPRVARFLGAHLGG